MLIKRYSERFVRFWFWVITRFISDHGFIRAASLTFISLLAIAPVFTVLFRVISAFPIYQKALGSAQAFIAKNFIPTFGQSLLTFLDSIEHQTKNLPVLSIILLIVSVVLMVLALERNVNEIWRIPYRRRLSTTLVVYWGMILLGPLLLLTAVSYSSYLDSYLWFKDLSIGPWQHIDILPFMIGWFGFALLYYVVPHSKVEFKHAAIGALFAVVLFAISRECFAYYIAYIPTYRAVYGALSVIPLFLLWVYIVWIIFFLGVEVVNGLSLNQAKRSVLSVPLFLVAYRIMGRLYTADRLHGDGVNLFRLVYVESNCSLDTILTALNALQSCQLVTRGHGVYSLAVDLDEMTLEQFAQKVEFYVPVGMAIDDAEDPWNKALQDALAPISQAYHAQQTSMGSFYQFKQEVQGESG